jgi:SAM-dependent methyltransferase
MDRVRVAVAPVRFGAGIKGKVVTAMSHGVPNVVTTIAAEGIGITDGTDALVADSPEAFADAVVRMYTDEALWNRVSTNGLALARRRFSFDGGVPIVAEILASLGLPTQQAGGALRCLVPRDELECVRLAGLEDERRHVVDSASARERWRAVERALVPDRERAFTVDAYCIACGAPSRMDVSYAYHVQDATGRPVPNWREHLVCGCGMNARVRALVHVLTELEGLRTTDAVYVMEQRSPLARWLARRCGAVVGSEFLGAEVEPGSLVGAIRHEDATRLSFADEMFDYVISCDVFEHVPDYRRAFAEAWRCLRPGGRLLFTVPFLADSPHTHVRARISPSGAIEHLAPAEYHGDPQRPNEGALCFQHFGWDLLADLRASGFASAECLLLWSRAFGYLGDHRVFKATKPCH